MIILPIIHLLFILCLFKLGHKIKIILKNKLNNIINLTEAKSQLDIEIDSIKEEINLNNTPDKLTYISKLKRKLITLEKQKNNETNNKQNNEKPNTIYYNILILICDNKILFTWVSTLIFRNYFYVYKFDPNILYPISNLLGDKLEHTNLFKFKFTFFYSFILVRFINNIIYLVN